MWAENSVFYQIYPLGFCGAPKENDGVTVNRIGKIAKKLEAAGLIKCLRKGNVQRKNNAVWLLTIGTPEENAEVEAYVRQHMYL